MHPTANLLLILVAAAASIKFVVTDAQRHHPLPAANAGAACVPHERDALLAFKTGITSDPAGLLASWQEGDEDCCRWGGVQCSNQTGHVIKLQLRNEHLDNHGHLIAPMVGQISHSLLSLEHLEHLDLSWNNLNRPTDRIPKFIGCLMKLKYLNLSGIPFSGRVPPHLGNLSDLQYLDLSSMGLGNTYSTDVSWLKRLPFLEYLDLSKVDLSAVADWPQVVNMIPSARVLDLSHCSLTSANQSLPRLNLTNLEVLDLSYNYFDHPIASSWFWNITHLKHLILRSTSLHGSFPSALQDMASLQILDISQNIFNSRPKCIMTTSLRNLCNLEYLDLERNLLFGNITELLESLPHCSSNKLRQLYLSSNNITGVLPNWMGQLTSLTILDLSVNNITGPLPPFIGHFTCLRILDLSDNRLTGQVPYEIGWLTNLTYLVLKNNDLDGVITQEHFTSLESLQHIDLSYNSLRINFSSEWQPPFRLHDAYFAACQIGPRFPSWLRLLVHAENIDISSGGIMDSLPEWFSSVFSNALFMNMSKNKLNGHLPRNMELMSLKELLLSSNQLTGQIPPLPVNITWLDISRNSLSGPLPTNFGVPRLEVLSLSCNRITGRIPRSICTCANLIMLDLANNYIEGELPPCFFGKLDTLQLCNNKLSGEFPSFVQNCTNLRFLDLGRNMFYGSLPIWIGNLVRLEFLQLSNNRFSGNFPESITGCGCFLYLDIAHNGISGSLPRHLSNLTSMKKEYWENGHPLARSCNLRQASPGVSFSAVTKEQHLIYYSTRSNKIGIDLSLNNLSGEIPEDIVFLEALPNLNLSWNHLRGKIPDRIGAMLSLESLDLSRNILSGEIPASLSNLTFLSYLDLSYNNLTGRIPSGSQLDTLYAYKPTLYDGNVGLCGAPLKKNCSSTDASKKGRGRRMEDHEQDTFLFGLGLGCIVGLWVVFCILLFHRPWRFAYFRLFDRLHDKAHVFVSVTWARWTRKKAAANKAYPEPEITLIGP